jgi:hypothetical protein
MSAQSAEAAHTPPPHVRVEEVAVEAAPQLAPVERVVERIITPYNADTYEDYLARFDLTDKYPDLVFNLRNGFPIGNMPPLSRSYTPSNHKSALEHPEVIRDYLAEECSFGQMSGPYTHQQIEQELSGHFVSCPLGLVEKAGEPGKFRIICDLSYKNKEDNYSVNSFLDADDFPTEWGTASQVAEIVCLSTMFNFFSAYMHLHLLLFRGTFCALLHILHFFAPSAFLHTFCISRTFCISFALLRCFIIFMAHICACTFCFSLSWGTKSLAYAESTSPC